MLTAFVVDRKSCLRDTDPSENPNSPALGEVFTLWPEAGDILARKVTRMTSFSYLVPVS